MKGILINIETDIKNEEVENAFLNLIPNVEEQYLAFGSLTSKNKIDEMVTLLTKPYKRFYDLLIINGISRDKASKKTINAFRNIYECVLETQNDPNRHKMTGVYFEVFKDLKHDGL